MKTITKILLLILPIAFLVIACQDDDIDMVYKATPYEFDIPERFPTDLNIPEDNPMTVEGVELGRHLFYDGRISGRTHPDSLMTCATCHRQSSAFDIGMDDHPKFADGMPYGLTGIHTPHVTLPLFNLVWNSNGYLWNGMIHESNTRLGAAPYGIPAEPQYHMRNLESLVWMGIAAPHEMNGHPDKTVALLKTIDIYPPMFEKAFGDPEITYERMSKAIAQFVRSIVSSTSKAHKAFEGKVNFTDAERRGYELFMTEDGADCFHCHGGKAAPLFTTNLFYNNAKDTCFTGVCADPRDRYAVTGDPMDLGAYKATTLINIEHQGPYMHDGRFETLDEVLNFYNFGLQPSPYAHELMHKAFPPYDHGMALSPPQLADLKAFLLSLTDDDFINDPKYSNPRPNDPYFINF